jgi:hypothetical protein
MDCIELHVAATTRWNSETVTLRMGPHDLFLLTHKDVDHKNKYIFMFAPSDGGGGGSRLPLNQKQNEHKHAECLEGGAPRGVSGEKQYCIPDSYVNSATRCLWQPSSLKH